MDQLEILQKELLAKNKIIDYLESELRSYSETVLILTSDKIKTGNLLNEKNIGDFITTNKHYSSTQEQFTRLKHKSKNYLKTLKLLETKNNEQSQHISKIELLNERLKISYKELEETCFVLRKKLKDSEKQNQELESLKIAQARIINELFYSNSNTLNRLKITPCEQISVKSNFILAHIKSLSMDDYENEFFKESYSFNQESSFNSVSKSGQHTNNSTLKDFQSLSLLPKKETLSDVFLQNSGFSKVFQMLENFFQMFCGSFNFLENEFNLLNDRILKISCRVQQVMEGGKRKGSGKEFVRLRELEDEVEEFMEKEEAYEGIVKELEGKIDEVLAAKRDLMKALSIEKEKNEVLSQQLNHPTLPIPISENPPQPKDQETSSDSTKIDIESIKALAETEKNYFLDHIIMIEKENTSSLANLSKQVSNLTRQVQCFENIFTEIESVLGKLYSGDLVNSIKTLVKKCSDKPSSWNPFRRSQTKALDNQSPKSDEELPHYIVNNLKKQLAHEKKLRNLDKKQLEGLREMLRHLEFEQQIGSNAIIFKNLRMMVVDLCQNLPLMNAEVEKKIQTLLALIWLNKDEKLEMENRKSSTS